MLCSDFSCSHNVTSGMEKRTICIRLEVDTTIKNRRVKTLCGTIIVGSYQGSRITICYPSTNVKAQWRMGEKNPGIFAHAYDILGRKKKTETYVFIPVSPV